MSQGLHVMPLLISASLRPLQTLFDSQCCISLLFLLLLHKNRRLRRWTDHLSFFAPSDQLSYLNNCFDLLSFSSPPIGLHATSSLYYFSHNLLFRLFQSLFTFALRCVIVSSIVFMLPYQFLFTYYLPQGSLVSPVLFLVTLLLRCESLHPAPYVLLYVIIISACRIDQVNVLRSQFNPIRANVGCVGLEECNR